MSAADCERWENSLLDLAYGELDEPAEREVRAHLDGCDHCRGALEKLTRGRALARKLPQLEPPPEVVSAVLRAARDKALEVEAARAEAARKKEEAALPSAPERTPEPDRTFWSWLLGIAMSPQFAMVSLLVLTVGVGLWWFPGVTGRRPTAPPLVSEPTAPGTRPEALAPAEPLRFDVDPRTGRVEALAEGEEAGSHEEEGEARPDRRIRIASAHDEERTEGGSEASAIAAAAGIELADGAGAGTVIESPLPTGDGLGASSLAAATETAPAGAAVAIPSTERVVTSPMPAMTDEVEAPTPDGPTMMAAGLLRQARELARAGRDRDAVSQYEALLTRYPSSSEAPQAMVEVAEIYRRMGLPTRARRWLERAAEVPAVASAARRELLRLDAAEAARVEGAAPPGEAAVAPTSE